MFSRIFLSLSSEGAVVRFPPSLIGLACFLSRFCLPFFRFDASLKEEEQGNHRYVVNPDLVNEPFLRFPCLQDSWFHREKRYQSTAFNQADTILMARGVNPRSTRAQEDTRLVSRTVNRTLVVSFYPRQLVIQTVAPTQDEKLATPQTVAPHMMRVFSCTSPVLVLDIPP